MSPQPETLRQRIIRRVRRLIPPRSFRIILEQSRGTRGIEIGGPSALFRRWNMWSVYPVLAALDNYNFASRTLWSEQLGSASQLNGRQFIGEAAEMTDVPSSEYDFLLASHVLEHIANPLKALHSWVRVVKPGGMILLVVPHRDGTFDHRRPITTMGHIVSDFDGDVTERDDTHVQEILDLHDLSLDPGAGTREVFITRAHNNFEHRSLHHHVFDTELVLRLVDKARLRIRYVDVELPFHICVACSSPTRTDAALGGDDTSTNASYWAPGAAWRRTSPFRADWRPGEG